MCRQEYKIFQYPDHLTSRVSPWGVGGSTEQGDGDLGRHGGNGETMMMWTKSVAGRKRRLRPWK